MEKNVKYTAVPVEEPNKNAAEVVSTDSCCRRSHRNCRDRRRSFRIALFGLLALVLVGRFLFSGFGGFSFWRGDSRLNNEKDTPQGTPFWKLPPWGPSAPDCSTDIEWQGAKEYLLDPDETNGFMYSVRGASSRGSVTIRKDLFSFGHIKVRNHIYLSEESLQEQVKVLIDLGEDSSMRVETPSFDGPFPTKRCVRVETEIIFPANVEYFKSLAVDVPNAWIEIKDLIDLEFAFLNLHTGNGHIKVDDVSIASGVVGTVNGHIHGEFLVSEDLEIQNTNGAIDVRTNVNPWADDVAISAKSINGQVDVCVNGIKKDQIIDLYAHSINGGVIAAVGHNFHGNFSASTLIGYASVEGPDLTFEKNTRNTKIGFKGEKPKGHKISSAKIDAVTGSVELKFR